MQELLRRITVDRDVLSGKPVIRGLRISVEMILELLAKGAEQQEILEDFPELDMDDIRAALLYAHHGVAGEATLDRAVREKRLPMRFPTHVNPSGAVAAWLQTERRVRVRRPW